VRGPRAQGTLGAIVLSGVPCPTDEHLRVTLLVVFFVSCFLPFCSYNPSSNDVFSGDIIELSTKALFGTGLMITSMPLKEQSDILFLSLCVNQQTGTAADNIPHEKKVEGGQKGGPIGGHVSGSQQAEKLVRTASKRYGYRRSERMKMLHGPCHGIRILQLLKPALREALYEWR
jgi:hypothetical protein